MNDAKTLKITEPQSAWNATMDSYLTIKTRKDAFMAEHYMPHFNQFQAGGGYTIPIDVDLAADALRDHSGDLQDALMAIPAPDGAALQWKLDKVMASYSEGSIWSDWYVSQTIADYRRLLAPAELIR